VAALPHKPTPREKGTPAPSGPPSYTETTLRDGVAIATTKVVVGTAARPAPAKPAALPAPVVPAGAIARAEPPPAVAVAPRLAAASGAAPSSAPIKASSATEFVTRFLDAAFRIARTGDMSPQQRRAQLGELFAANMDIADIAGYTTGQKLAVQPADFQQRFRSILISYLVETYYPKIEAAADRSVSVEITPVASLADGTAVVWTVFTKEGWGAESVKWHLVAANGSFRVADTFSGGASLVEMERATFLSVMRNGGVPSLMAKLDARTRELASAAR
jgi:ABC-type transporter MlaC component